MSAWSSDVCSRSEEHTSELQSHSHLVCRLLLEKKEIADEFEAIREVCPAHVAPHASGGDLVSPSLVVARWPPVPCCLRCCASSLLRAPRSPLSRSSPPGTTP